jgi:DNA-binding response OmpR family regulator
VRFEIVLPRASDEDAPRVRSRPRAPRVILAARDTGIVRLVTAVMEADGLVPTVVPSLDDAISTAAANDADLLVVDQASFGAPSEATYDSRHAGYAVPSLILRDPAQAAPRWAGPQARFLHTPFTAAELLQAVRELMGDS